MALIAYLAGRMDVNNPWHWLILIGLIVSALSHLYRIVSIIRKAGKEEE